MRVKHCAARQIEELPFEQVAGATSKRDAVVEFQSVFCAGTAAHRFLDGLTEAARRRLLAQINDRLENDVTPVLVARNGREGVDLALETKPDLILLDVMMPELSGWEVCTTLKNAPETRQTPIAMMTVKSEIRDLITGMQVGADDYLTKPFTRRKLLETVRRLLDQRGESAPSFLTSENEQVRHKSLLFDPITELPTVPVIIDALRDRLLDSRDLAVHTVASLDERRLRFLADDVVAQLDAFVADEDGRPRNELADLVLRLTAKRAVESALAVAAAARKLGHSCPCVSAASDRPLVGMLAQFVAQSTLPES